MRDLFHVVDDQPLINEFIAAVLMDTGYRSLTFSSPGEYLEHLNAPDFERPQAVITDISMPGMSGYEMIEHIRARIPDMRFIIISGDPSFPSAKKPISCMYLVKPFTVEGVIEVVNKVALCESSAPSEAHGCGAVGDRNAFNVPDWQCPLENKIKSK